MPVVMAKTCKKQMKNISANIYWFIIFDKNKKEE